MYAIRVVGPSGRVWYWNGEGIGNLSNKPCYTFDAEEDAQLEIDCGIPLYVKQGRVVDVVNLEGE